MTPTPSHLLTTALRDFFPSEGLPQFGTRLSENLPYIHRQNAGYIPASLPQGHHSVYFPTAVPSHSLLPDGTDTLHSPAAPTLFTRRLWAGGSLEFKRPPARGLYLDGTRAVCIEAIKDVVIKGPPDQEKVFVHIERKIAHVFPLVGGGRQFEDIYADEGEIVRRVWNGSKAAVIEKRELVFMRKNEKGSRGGPASSEGRIVKPSHNPDYSVRLIVTPSLLFRFSALTFNAHAIHLDPEYCREVEGHRNLLVHGPLTLVLMLSVLRRQLGKGEEVESFSYRNLAPLYACEEMRVCLKRDREKTRKFDVWIEGSSGGYAVRGTAVIAKTDIDPDINSEGDSEIFTPRPTVY